MSPTSNNTNTSGTGSQPSASSSNTTQSGSVNENMFLQLLVAQLQNQDPLNPPDGTQFVTQLAQFQTLEQDINTGQNIASILSDINSYMGISSSTTSSGATPQS
ncbi:MAG TPA: flagellar hook capping FlgD N-terminal domain-containing protein [Bryobacteraceae bacterium]|nr:flagellar hook capping FlgD N-terminal domain-containing protein [Bryobacteraceae bacterium]